MTKTDDNSKLTNHQHVINRLQLDLKASEKNLKNLKQSKKKPTRNWKKLKLRKKPITPKKPKTQSIGQTSWKKPKPDVLL